MTRLVGQGLPVRSTRCSTSADYPAALERLREGRAARQDRPPPPEALAGARVGSSGPSCRRPHATSVTAMDGPATDLSDAKARLAAEIDRRARPAGRRVPPDPRPPRAGLRGALRPRPADRRARGRGPRRHPLRPGVETAFEAHAGSAGPTVAVLCEYDALPGIGHACGHNVIAAAGLGAGLAAAALADELGGRVVVLGTPAEEGGGGKVRLIDGGRLRRRRRRADGPPRRRRPAGDGRRSPSTQVHVTYTGRGGARRGVPAPGPQRPRRRRARLRQRGGAAPAHRAGRAHPRHHHRGRRQAQHRARLRPAAEWIVRSPTAGGPRAAEGPVPRLPAGRVPTPPAARWTSSGSTPSTPT